MPDRVSRNRKCPRTGAAKDKYPSIFLGQMEDIVFIILQIFFAAQPDILEYIPILAV